MENVDTQEIAGHDDEKMFLSDVIQDEHELLFLDSYLRESFRRHGMGGSAGSPDAFDIAAKEGSLH